MFVIINNQQIVVALSDFPVNEEDCATRGEVVISTEMLPDVGSYYDGTQFIPQPSIYHVLSSGQWIDGRDLQFAKDQAISAIDKEAEIARSRYITLGSGQAMTYQEKADQAIDYVAAGYPADTTNYPMIQADANVYQITPQQAADTILAQRAAWLVKGAEIEQIRLNGKMQVAQGATQTEVDTIKQQTITALQAV